MPSFFDKPTKTLRQLLGKSQKDTVGKVAERFLQAFRDHGVAASQIPRLLPQISLDDVQSPAKLLAALTPEILDTTAQLFGIRSEWLEGVDDDIYFGCWTYKDPSRLLEHIASSVTTDDARWHCPLRVLTSTKKLDRSDPEQQLLVPVLIEEVAEIGEEKIYRCHVYRDGFDWSGSRTRIELKAIARLVYQRLRVVVPLYQVTPKQMDEILGCRAIPWRYINGCLLTEPSLEDFALSTDESRKAKEVEELPDVLRCIEENHLQAFSFVRTETFAAAQEPQPAARPEVSEPPETREPPKKSGKRQVQAAIWDAIRTAATALWAQDKHLSIADMILRLRHVPGLKATAMSDSAICKRICDLAPVGIRGKSGRKSKQSA